MATYLPKALPLHVDWQLRGHTNFFLWLPRFLEAIKVENFRDIFYGHTAEPNEQAARKLALHDDLELEELDLTLDTPELANARGRDRKTQRRMFCARSLLRAWISEEVEGFIHLPDHPCEIFTSLLLEFGVEDLDEKEERIYEEAETLLLSHCHSMDDYLHRHESWFNELLNVGLLYTPDAMITNIIEGLPEEFLDLKVEFGVLIPRPVQAHDVVNLSRRLLGLDEIHVQPQHKPVPGNDDSDSDDEDYFHFDEIVVQHQHQPVPGNADGESDDHDDYYYYFYFDDDANDDDGGLRIWLP